MMTLLAFITVTLIILAIARYNEDDALFWKLFLSFAGVFTAVSLVNYFTEDNKKQDKVVMIQSSPTQVLSSVPSLYAILADISNSATKREKSPKPEGQDISLNQNNVILCEVHTSARGQPTWRMFFDDG